PHGVSQACRGVQVDQGRAPGDLSEGIGHRDGGGLLQRQDVAEIAGEFLQEGLLGRTWITEDGRQSEGPQQIVGHTSDSGFLGHALLSQPPAGRASYQAHQTEPVVRAPLTMNALPHWHAMKIERQARVEVASCRTTAACGPYWSPWDQASGSCSSAPASGSSSAVTTSWSASGSSPPRRRRGKMPMTSPSHSGPLTKTKYA